MSSHPGNPGSVRVDRVLVVTSNDNNNEGNDFNLFPLIAGPPQHHWEEVLDASRIFTLPTIPYNNYSNEMIGSTTTTMFLSISSTKSCSMRLYLYL
jgi:hypothetical protein